MTVLDLGCGMGFFSIGMAKLVGDSGRIIAIDLQQKMLDVLMKRAGRSGVARRIQPYRCEPDDIGVHGPGDFALAFYMFHEVPKQHRFLEQLRRSLKPAAGFLLVEPAIHVRKNAFEESIAVVQSCGFLLRERPVVRLSHAALFEYANG
jgi:ubiquinone/menaquinone biosynthesis C-methylase UbiE